MTRLLGRKPALYALTFAASLLISAVIQLRPGVINKDGILYLAVAQRFLEGGIEAAFALFNWPLYSILIAGLHGATGWSPETAAHVLNALLIALCCTSFVALYAETTRPDDRPWVAALLILSLPVVNDYRDLIVRDFGAWAFTLLSALQFLRFTQSPTLSRGLYWQLATLIAGLFRIEALIFFVAPVLYYARYDGSCRHRWRLAVRSSYLAIAMAMGAGLFVSWTGLTGADPSSGALANWLSYASPERWLSGFEDQATRLHTQLEYIASTDEAGLVLAGGLLTLALYKLVSNAVPAYLLVTGYGLKRRWRQPDSGTRVIFLFLALALSAVLAVLFSRYFLSSRYTVIPVLLLSLLSFRYVDEGLRRLAKAGHRRWLVAAWSLIAALFLDGIVSTSPGKEIMREAAQWTAESLVDPSPCVCNEVRLQFYAGGRCRYIDEEIDRTVLAASPGGYLLLWIDRHAPEDRMTRNNDLRLLRMFQDRRGNKVAIFAKNANHLRDSEGGSKSGEL